MLLAKIGKKEISIFQPEFLEGCKIREKVKGK